MVQAQEVTGEKRSAIKASYVEDLPVNTPIQNFKRGSKNTKLEKGISTGIMCDSIDLFSMEQDIDSHVTKGAISPDDAELKRLEEAAIKAQAALGGYLARQAYLALKGIIRIQELIRGHLVRRQVVATLRCMQAIVRVRELARGQKARLSDSAYQVSNKYISGEPKQLTFITLRLEALDASVKAQSSGTQFDANPGTSAKGKGPECSRGPHDNRRSYWAEEVNVDVDIPWWLKNPSHVAAMYLEGDALDLFAWINNEYTLLYWEDLVKSLQENYGLAEFQNPDEHLYVRIHKPRTVYKATSLAMEFEKKVSSNHGHKGSQWSNLSRSNTTQIGSARDVPYQSVGNQFVSQTDPNFAQISPRPSPNCAWEIEKQNHIAKGLYFRCNGKFTPGHRCKTTSLTLMEANDNIEGDESREQMPSDIIDGNVGTNVHAEDFIPRLSRSAMEIHTLQPYVPTSYCAIPRINY
ncbi:hypothetical protein KY284_034186 [Solanum tuberosum]|nr:hypothetical protein KY284_034186 [Solanum tuberosum]